MNQVTLTIESDIDNLGLVVVAVHGTCEYLGADKEESSQIEFCVHEAVANSVQHACQHARDQVVSVRIVAAGIEIQCDVCDSGLPLPAANVEALKKRPTDAEFFDQRNSLREEHGRGLKIIASLMDEVAYFRQGTANCLRMKKRIQAEKVFSSS